MSGSPDVTATIILRDEGILAIPALASMRDAVDAAREDGLLIEATAILAQADDLTQHVVRSRGGWLCNVQDAATEDLGLAMNAAAALARGEFLTVLYGGLLWGAQWLRLAHAAATAAASRVEAIWHPAMLYHFTETDFDRHSTGKIPDPLARSGFSIQPASDDKTFRREMLLLTDLWSGNVFARRSIHRRIPHAAVAPGGSFEAGCWRWNVMTVWQGIAHRVVLDTVHLIRLKDSPKALMPDLPAGIELPLGHGTA